MVVRRVRQRVVDTLEDTRVVFVMGPRQAGKSTLVEQLVAAEFGATVFTLLPIRRPRRLSPPL
jgi:predicted AAA+ superfamily ATPase